MFVSDVSDFLFVVKVDPDIFIAYEEVFISVVLVYLSFGGSYQKTTTKGTL